MNFKKNLFNGGLALLAVLALVFSSMSCGGKTEDGKVVLTVQAEQGWMPYYQEAAKRVQEANPDAEIQLIEVGAFDHLDKIDSTDASNQDVADLFAIPADRLYGLAENEILASIDSQKLAEEIGGWSDFDAGLGGNLKVKDEYLAFPFNIETLITFVNVANAKAKGIDYTKPFEIKAQKDPATVLLPLFDTWYGVAPLNSAEIELLGKRSDGLLFSNFSM